MGITRKWPKRENRLEIELDCSVSAWLRNQNIYPISQFETPWGVADFMGIQLDLDRVLERRDCGQMAGIGSDQYVAILLSIPETDSLATESGIIEEFDDLIGADRVRTILKSLRKNRFVQMDANGFCFRWTPWLPFHRKLIAVELKLKRIEEVLNQAKRHLTITPFSYVALPPLIAGRIASSSRAEEFRDAGVGLLAVEKGTCNELIAPSLKTSQQERVFEIAAAEKCWREVLRLKTI